MSVEEFEDVHCLCGSPFLYVSDVGNCAHLISATNLVGLQQATLQLCFSFFMVNGSTLISIFGLATQLQYIPVPSTMSAHSRLIRCL